MKKTTYLFVIIFTILISCNKTEQTKLRIKYNGYHLYQGLGQSIKLHLDSVTPLKTLVSQLEHNNKLLPTHKGFLIGYNDLMYSIAVYGDSAINPLVELIHRTKVDEAKVAGIYTLYLIGVDCTQRFNGVFEKFTNMRAREALLRLMKDDITLQPRIMILLLRYPLSSDVPVMFDIMNKCQSDCWAISCGLLGYDLREIPLAQKIPEKILRRHVYINNQRDVFDEKIIGKVFQKMLLQQKKYVSIEDTLFNYQFEKHVGVASVVYAYRGKSCSVYSLCMFCTYSELWLGSNYLYYYKDNKIRFCSSKTSKQLWMNWWKSQSKSYKETLKSSNKRINARWRDI